MDVNLQEKISPDVARHLGKCTACKQFLLSLRDTVCRIEKQSSGKLSSACAGRIRQVILQHNRSLMKPIARAKSAHH